MAEYVSPKKPIPLFTHTSDEPAAWLCGVCKHVASEARFALYCCGNPVCLSCGALGDKPYLLCAPCRQKSDADKELAAFAKATKIHWREHTGFLYIEGLGGHRNGYFTDLDDLLCFVADELFDDPEFDLPDYAWACDEQKLTLDACSILESALEEHHEDAIESVDVDGLQEALDTWCKANPCVSYFESHTHAVDLDGAFDELIKEALDARKKDGGAA